MSNNQRQLKAFDSTHFLVKTLNMTNANWRRRLWSRRPYEPITSQSTTMTGWPTTATELCQMWSQPSKVAQILFNYH